MGILRGVPSRTRGRRCSQRSTIGMNMGLGEGKSLRESAYESYGSMGLVGVKALLCAGH